MGFYFYAKANIIYDNMYRRNAYLQQFFIKANYKDVVE